MNSPIDMTAFIAAKSDQLNADDLTGGPRTITITGVKASPDSAEQPISIHFEGDDGKPFKPCKTVRRIMVGVWGPLAAEYVGRSMTLYRDPKVAFGGMQVGGIRVSHMSHMEREVVIAANATRGKKAAHKIFPLAAQSNGNRDRAGAEKWVADHLGFVAGAADIERLDRVIGSGTKAMAKLSGTETDLHEKVTAAYAARRSELEGEGPSDDQRGERSTTSPDDVIAKAQAVTDMDALMALTDDWFSGGNADASDEDLKRAEGAFDAARARIAGLEGRA